MFVRYTELIILFFFFSFENAVDEFRSIPYYSAPIIKLSFAFFGHSFDAYDRETLVYRSSVCVCVLNSTFQIEWKK